MKPLISFNSFAKSYGSFQAVSDLSLTIKKGQVFGFLGANGAGKTTTIRSMIGLMSPSSGSITLLGENSTKLTEDTKRKIGYLPSELDLYPNMTGKQILTYFQNLEKSSHSNTIEILSKKFDADLSKKFGALSTGNKRKIGIIQAFMHDPELIILDEPTSGLDPLMQESFYDLIKEYKKKGTTFFFSSHNLMEVQKICTHVGFIKDGKLIDAREVSSLSELSSTQYHITFHGKPPINEFQKIPSIEIQNHNEHTISLKIAGEPTELLKVLAKHKISHLEAHPENIEDIFIKYYQ